MSLRTKVKVGNINNLSEARYCSGMGVDLLGFPVAEPGLNPVEYKQLIEWVSGPQFVLEAHHSRVTDLHTITDNYPGHYIEIGIHQLDWLANKELNFIVATSCPEWQSVSAKLLGKDNISFIELSAIGLDRSIVEEICNAFPTLMVVGTSLQLEAVRHLPVAGIAMLGSSEERPGVKDYSGISEILESLEE